jgi:hypothetical protein
MPNSAYEKNPSPSSQTYVACTDAGISLIAPTDKDPRDGTKLLNAGGGQFTHILFICPKTIELISVYRLEFPSGAYFLEGDGKGFNNFIAAAYKDRTTGKVRDVHEAFFDVGGDTEAATSYGSHDLVVFCLPGLNKPANPVLLLKI